MLAIVAGLANTVALFGWGPLNPTNITWVFGDNATYYMGWGLYRDDPHLSFPLAWTDRVGYPVGTSIALLDAIPLVAILLRPLSPILPVPFQYLGLYSALCFVLQMYFGVRLCRRLFPSHPASALLGGVFFLLSPPLTLRAFGHTALLSQWLILAGLDGYFRDPADRPVRWLGRLWVTLALAAAITPYLAAMSFLVSVAGVTRLVLERRCRLPQAALLLATTVGILFATLATVGVLVTRDASTYWAPGYGLFSLNLNALVNPMEYGSILLPKLPVIDPAQFEGYNYLGLGIIALLVAGLVRRPASIMWLAEPRIIPLVGLALACTAVAASASVSFGSSTLFTVPLPRGISSILNGLRASGRLFWPAYYLLMAAALSLTVRVFRAPYGIVILAAALVVQVADVTPLRTKVRAATSQRFESPLQSSAWKGLGRKYDNLILIPPYQCDPFRGGGGIYSYVTFGKLAAAERMRTNSYYSARATRAELLAHCVDILRTQLEGTLDPRSAYVVTDAVRTVWDLNEMHSHVCQQADGYNLCTPSASPRASPAAAASPEAARYVMDDVLEFTKGGSAARYLTFGWGDPLADGTWTEGPMAVMRLGLAAPDHARSLVLTLTASAFVARRHPSLDVDVVVNGRAVDLWSFDAASLTRRQARIPAAVVAARRELDIEFRVRNPDAPLYLGAGPSASFLGLFVRALTVGYD
jgi:hypothetical protein